MSSSRSVRVFLSSTFRDFGEERDLLVRKVFPGLRAKLKDRFVELVDVDLRWGITAEEAERGEVLPIGGLKEKLLAAHRGGIKLVLIPEENVKDLIDIPDNVKNAIEIVPVRWIDKVLELALERKPEPLPDPSPEELAKKAAESAKSSSTSTSGDVIKH